VAGRMAGVEQRFGGVDVADARPPPARPWMTCLDGRRLRRWPLGIRCGCIECRRKRVRGLDAHQSRRPCHVRQVHSTGTETAEYRAAAGWCRHRRASPIWSCRGGRLFRVGKAGAKCVPATDPCAIRSPEYLLISRFSAAGRRRGFVARPWHVGQPALCEPEEPAPSAPTISTALR